MIGIILGCIAWVLLGMVGFMYWWTTEFDLTIWSLFGSIIVGVVFGPVAWIIGMLIHRDRTASPIVIMKSRGKR